LTLRTGLGTVAETWIGASKNTSDINDNNRIKEQFISSQAFHQTPGGRIREITIWVQLELENLEFFDPAAQEQHRDEFLQ
jgi:hypothetical protein